MDGLYIMFYQVTLAILLSLSSAQFSWAKDEPMPVSNTAGAGDVPPRKAKIHIVDLPKDAEPILWTRENRQGLKVVLLKIHEQDPSNRLALVDKDGSIVKSISCNPSYMAPMTKIVWLNSVSFALIGPGSKNSSYCIYSFFPQGDGEYCMEFWFDGTISGRAQFRIKKNCFLIIREDQSIISIRFQDQ